MAAVAKPGPALTIVESVPRLPVLLATRLQLELLLGGPFVDLSAAAGVVLNDIGATVAIFQCAARELDGEVPERVEECLASLASEAWVDAISSEAVERLARTAEEQKELLDFWERARLLAYATWTCASEQEEICPERAYLVGLLHELHRLPELLRWEPSGSAQQKTAWKLPEFLHALLDAPALPASWAQLLSRAHAWLQGEPVMLEPAT